MAAKLPEAATTAVAWAGTSRLARRTAEPARPAPSATRLGDRAGRA
jgi:hypothetical protein